MSRRRPAEQPRWKRGPDDSALVFKLKPRPELSPLALDALDAPDVAPETNGLRAVLDYVRAHADHGASLRTLFSSGGHHGGGDGDFFLAPDPNVPNALADVRYLRARSSEDRARLQDALRRDPRVAYVHRPARLRAQPIARAAPLDLSSTRWGLERCGFDAVWPTLEVGDDPGEIAVIDQGVIGLGHRELQPVVRRIPRADGPGSIAKHAAGVCAVIAARRGEVDGRPHTPDMDGCCSARLRVYDAWTREAEFDYVGCCEALYEAARLRLPVVNVSLAGDEPEERETTMDAALAYCRSQGVVVVAAAGDSGPQGRPLYPARSPHVIAVAATDGNDRPIQSSGGGAHICLAAPGLSIWTVINDTDYDWAKGTSVAAPYVTAAVWLAKRHTPGLTPDDVTALLRSSVDPVTAPKDGRDDRVGFGRLDVRRMCAQLLGH